VVRWRLIDLVQWLWDKFRVSVSAATVGRELPALGERPGGDDRHRASTATYGLDAGATAAAATKTVNRGTGGPAGSAPVVNIGSDTPGAAARR
jgi:hypothetical protein